MMNTHGAFVLWTPHNGCIAKLFVRVCVCTNISFPLMNFFRSFSEGQNLDFDQFGFPMNEIDVRGLMWYLFGHVALNILGQQHRDDLITQGYPMKFTTQKHKTP